MIVLKINVLKIPKERIFVGQKGKYLDLVLHDNRGGTDEWGNDGFVSVSVSKEERESGGKGEIVGNWKHVGPKAPPQRPPQRQAPPAQRKPADPDLDAPEDSQSPF